jgi:hypothetical protein
MQLMSWLNPKKNNSITLSSSLTGNGLAKINIAPEIKEVENQIRNQSTFYQKLTSYKLESTQELVKDDNIPVKGFNDSLPAISNPAIEGARNKALSKIDKILAKINKFKEEISEEEHPCPYEQLKIKYLGKNYVVPSIDSLSYPENFTPEKALPSTAAINASYYNIMLTHLHTMSAEAIDTSFPGITSENVGNAFAVPHETEKGIVYKINEKKLANHLEFAEIVRNIPLQQLIDNPQEISFKLIQRFIEINSDVDMTADLPFTVSEVTLPSIESIPQPQVEPQQSPRTEPLPFNHPALQYIAQPNYFSSPGIKLPTVNQTI